MTFTIDEMMEKIRVGEGFKYVPTCEEEVVAGWFKGHVTSKSDRGFVVRINESDVTDVIGKSVFVTREMLHSMTGQGPIEIHHTPKKEKLS